MHILSRFFFLGAAILLPALAPAAEKSRKTTPAAPSGTRDIGVVTVTGDKAIGVRVSANSPELQDLANRAFASHGRYSLVSSGHSYDIRFTAVGSTQVKVDVTRGAAATPVLSRTVAGTTARNALLRAADAVVEATNGLGLRGYFTARLAFIIQQGRGRGDVYTSDLFWGEAKRLTHDNALTLTPRWSPDGSRIIFTSYFRTNAPDIYTLDVASTRKETFLSLKGTNMGARFSPNGQQVAMVLSGDGVPKIWVGNAQGAKQLRAITTAGSAGAKSSPVWSPDGSRIVFAMEPGPQLYVVGAGGGTPQRLSTNSTYAAEPDWSVTNPNKIACTIRSSGSYQIAVYDFAKGSAQKVSAADFDAVEPTWLADGRHLVYTARSRTTSVLCILDTETGRSTPLGQANWQAVQASVWTPAR